MPDPQTVTEARKKLISRRTALARMHRQNETDGQALRMGETDSEELAAIEKMAGALIGLSERERREIGEIDAALSRLEAGTWGTCEKCGQPIGRQRLAVMPEARQCVNCALG